MNHYILKGTEIEQVPLMVWAAWFEDTDHIVAKTGIDDETKVSTIFLGIDHRFGFGDGPPLLFETMIFGGESNGNTWRYSTRKEAEAGHKKIVESLRNA